VEQDTFRLLAADKNWLHTGLDLQQRGDPGARQFRCPPGSVIITCKSPLRLDAVVYDIESSNGVAETKWVEAAAAECVRIADRSQIAELYMPLLGAAEGGLGPARAREAIRSGAMSHNPRVLQRVWLLRRMPADSGICVVT